MMSNFSFRKISTLLNVQYSNMLEYRVEIALWAISGIIPFFMLNIWTNNNLSIDDAFSVQKHRHAIID